MNRPAPPLPRFEIVATATGLLTPAEMDGLIADHAAQFQEGRLGVGAADSQVRRSQVTFLQPDGRHRWVYERIWDAAVGFNQRFFGVEITGIRNAIQLGRYDSADQGFYNWHMDFGPPEDDRKISLTVQLSDPADYDGGDLEFLFREAPFKAERTRGTMIAFPSFALHRVTPVTRGVRWSLVCWIAGPRWR